MGPPRCDLAWGATFIWMKQAMNAIQPEIEAYGRTPVVAALVGGRFLIAFVALLLISKEARSALSDQQLWKGGSILALSCLLASLHDDWS